MLFQYHILEYFLSCIVEIDSNWDEREYGISPSLYCRKCSWSPITNRVVTTRGVALLPFIWAAFWALTDTTSTKRKGAEDKSWGIHPMWGSKAPSSLILCHSEGTAWLSLDLPLKSKRLIVVNGKGFKQMNGWRIWESVCVCMWVCAGGYFRVSGCNMSTHKKVGGRKKIKRE